jgi:hypothetical protein
MSIQSTRNDYTILQGHLICGVHVCDIPFALVFNASGSFAVETFLPGKEFFEQTKDIESYKLIGKTEKGYDIEIEDLYLKRFSFSNCKMELVCLGFIKLMDNRREKPQIDGLDTYDDSIYIVEVEGLAMKFGHHTEAKRYRNGVELKEFFNHDFDHTSCAMLINFSEKEGNYYKLIFTKNPENENMIIDFSEHEGYNRLTYKNYLVIKNTLISFLSFVNGGDISVRKELTGSSVTTSGNQIINSQTVYIYSFKKEIAAYNDYFLPINKHRTYASKIIPHLFISCFDQYFQLNKKLDFNALVFSLNNSTQTIGLEEKYFILITALERLCNNYSKTVRDPKKTLIDNTLFRENIKPELDAVLKKYELIIKRENPSAWAIYKSKIGNINQSNNAETTQKLYELFAYAKIAVNSEVQRLVENERNQAVHEGIIGVTEENRINNYWKLDHILRDVILNLIGYKGLRKYTYKYFETS